MESKRERDLKTWVLAGVLLVCSGVLSYLIKTSIDRLLMKQDELVTEVRSLKDFAIEIRMSNEFTTKRVDKLEIRVDKLELIKH